MLSAEVVLDSVTILFSDGRTDRLEGEACRDFSLTDGTVAIDLVNQSLSAAPEAHGPSNYRLADPGRRGMALAQPTVSGVFAERPSDTIAVVPMTFEIEYHLVVVYEPI